LNYFNWQKKRALKITGKSILITPYFYLNTQTYLLKIAGAQSYPWKVGLEIIA
jgi:hypothetical protein